MGHVFISYSHKDTTYAHRLADSLQNMGIDVWIDERLDYGSQWPLEIQKQLDSCDAFILVMSPRSFASDWVQSELQRAKRKLKPIFPLLLEGDEPWLSVESTQYYDVRNKNLPDNKFYSALKRVVSVSPNDQTFSKVASPSSTTQPLKNIRPGLTTGILLGVGGFGVVSILCLVIMLPFLSKMFNPPPPSPSPTSIEITATDRPLLPVSPSTVPSTAEPTLTPNPLPTATWTLVPTDIPPTFTPEPILVSRDYDISLCCNSTGQRSGVIDYVLNVNTLGVLQLEFKAQMAGACSDIFFHILWDGAEIYQTNAVGPVSGRDSTDLLDLSSAISRGKHTLTISPEGILGGCNSGTLGGWAGTLTVVTSRNP